MGKKEYNYEGIMPRVLDTLCLARMINNDDREFSIKDLPQKMIQYYNFYSKQKKVNLAALAREYKIEIDETKTHGAAYDLQLTAQVLFHQLKQFKISA